jgi:hypothetical protein
MYFFHHRGHRGEAGLKIVKLSLYSIRENNRNSGIIQDDTEGNIEVI